MTLSNYRSEEKVEKLLKDLEVAENNILDQHELDLQKALQQANFLYIPLDEGKFDFDKDFYQGQLVPIDQILSGREVASALSKTPNAERINLDY